MRSNINRRLSNVKITNGLVKPRSVLVRESTSSGIKRVSKGVLHQVCHGRGVNVGKSEQTLGEKCWIQMGSKQATKLLIEDMLCFFPITKKITMQFKKERNA